MLLAENCEFFLPHSHLMPMLGGEPFGISGSTFFAKIRVFELSIGEDFVHAPFSLSASV